VKTGKINFDVNVIEVVLVLHNETTVIHKSISMTATIIENMINQCNFSINNATIDGIEKLKIMMPDIRRTVFDI